MIRGEAESSPCDFLFVQSTTEIGGAETVLLNLLGASAELRRRSMVVTLGFGEGNLPERLRALGVKVVELKLGRLRHPWKVLPTFLRLVSLTRASGARVVLGNGGHPQVIAGLLSRLVGARAVFFAHMVYPAPLRKNDPRDLIALAGPLDMTLGVSKAAQSAMKKLRPSVRNELLYNGTPLKEVGPAEAAAARAELGVHDGELLVGVFGRLQRWKGQDVFVEAAGKLARLRPGVRFAVVGGSVFGLEPEFFEGLKRRVVELGIADRVVFTGFRTDVPRLMAACDIVCHTSRVPEPFGLVIVEAMALRRPVVATRGGGPTEIIPSGDYGTLVPPDDSEALAGAILAFADDPARRQAVGAKARERVEAEFNVDVAAARLIAHLDSLLA